MSIAIILQRPSLEERMNGRVGFAAGELWKVLKENDNLSLTKIKTSLKKKSYTENETMMALGWLLREDKIDFNERKSGSRTTLSVSLK